MSRKQLPVVVKCYFLSSTYPKSDGIHSDYIVEFYVFFLERKYHDETFENYGNLMWKVCLFVSLSWVQAHQAVGGMLQ